MDKNNHDNVSLKEYFEAKFDGLREATNLARESMEKRLEGMNEFRSALKDQTAKFITRVEYEVLDKKIEEVKDAVNKRPTWLMTFIFLIMSFLLGLLVTHFLQ
jgi:hypothetical protein